LEVSGAVRLIHKTAAAKPEGKKPTRRPRRREKDNIETTFQVTGHDGEECIQMTQN
jgi:hypothetical protein